MPAMQRQIAILIDGGFFLRRLPRLLPQETVQTPEQIAKAVRRLCFNHVKRLTGDGGRHWQQHLYRVFFHDAQPYDGKAHHPLENRPLDFGKSDVARARLQLFECLRKERKLALRLGKVNRERDWTLAPQLTKKLLRTRQALAPLQRLQAGNSASGYQLTLSAQEAQLLQVHAQWQALQMNDVSLGLRQKGVDMRIAIDIASLALKRQAQTIVLVAGDSDFVPAAKLARREGMEFVLDPMWQSVNADLFEHIDDLQSGFKRPQRIGAAQLAADETQAHQPANTAAERETPP